MYSVFYEWSINTRGNHKYRKFTNPMDEPYIQMQCMVLNYSHMQNKWMNIIIFRCCAEKNNKKWRQKRRENNNKNQNNVIMDHSEPTGRAFFCKFELVKILFTWKNTHKPQILNISFVSDSSFTLPVVYRFLLFPYFAMRYDILLVNICIKLTQDV